MTSNTEEESPVAPAAPKEKEEEETPAVVVEDEQEEQVEKEPGALKPEQQDQVQQDHHDQQHHNYNLVQRAAMRMARWPKTHFWIAFGTSLILSFVGFYFGEFSVRADNAGWQSRGTLISDRHTQVLMVTLNADTLLHGTSDDWQELMDNVQEGWEVEGEDYLDEDDDNSEGDDQTSVTNNNRRRLLQREYVVDALLPHTASATKVPSMATTSMEAQKLFQKLLERHLQTNIMAINSTTTTTNSSTTSSQQPEEEEEQKESPPTNAPGTNAASSGTTTTTTTSTTNSSSSSMNAIPFLEHCDTDWYLDGRMVSSARLWPVWSIQAPRSALNPPVLEELCISELATQQYLQEEGLCFGCSDDDDGKSTCLPPYSLVLFARLTLANTGHDNVMTMDCTTLANNFAAYEDIIQALFQECAMAMETSTTTSDLNNGVFPDACPQGFYPSLIDEYMDTTGIVSFTSSIFATRGSEDAIEELYNRVDNFHKGTGSVQGAYDTQNEDFVNLLADSAVGTDMALATGSAFITSIAMLLHTRSPFLTLVGLIQIMLSFPLAFFTYRFIGGLTFFPFLNFIGVFVVFALGADHVFVAVDKWKNARKDFPDLSTEEIAAKALPDAAEAMFLTTSTTAIAFFGTAICPVAPVKLFAIFCGLLIVFDYVMDVLLVFPCLCIYDGYRDNTNCCITCHCCKMLEGGKDEINDDSEDLEGDNSSTSSSKKEEAANVEEPDAKMNGAENGMPIRYANGSTKDEGDQDHENDHHHHHHHHHIRYKDVDEDHKPSLIRRILLGYYHFLHKFRWPLLVACCAAFAVCLYYALTLELPTTSDVRILRDDHEFEKAYRWRLNLLSAALEKRGGSQAQVVWGVRPADTGDHNDPESWSQLVLDNSFDPSSIEAQTYLRDFCDKFFGEPFAETPYEGFQCPINQFDQWLQDQAMNRTDPIYVEFCNDSTGLPMDVGSFHPCLSAWAQEEDEVSILPRNGIVEVMYIPFTSRVRYDSRNSELDDEWHMIENWFDSVQSSAPQEVNKAYFSSFDFWWYDTNQSMFKTALGSAGIAISASAAIIIFSSRSLIMTLFSVFSVGYVLASVTSMMVASGWTLGFLESICFAILIGISVDFVIHFSHAYTSLPGIVSREKRTKHALVYMGPSILAAAFTTLAGATIMMFCVITFFTKFALCLFFTIIQSTLGSFVFFLTLTDCIGPTQPTYLVDKMISKCTGNSEKERASGYCEGPLSNGD